MEIIYKTGIIPPTEAIITVYESSEINRPTKDFERIAQMYANSNLVITAWNGDVLVGIARSLTDYCYCCYLSDLSVHKDFQSRGIGKKLIALTKDYIGDQCTLILIAAPSAVGYYPKIGMEKIADTFLLRRKS